MPCERPSWKGNKIVYSNKVVWNIDFKMNLNLKLLVFYTSSLSQAISSVLLSNFIIFINKWNS